MFSPRFALFFGLSIALLGSSAVNAQTPAKSPAPARPSLAAPQPGATASTAPALPAQVVDPQKVVITVGEDKVTADEFNKLIEALPEQYRASARGPGRRQFAEQLAQLKVLSQEAKRRKLDQTPAFQQQLQLQRENLLATTLYQDLAGHVSVTDEALHKYYDEHQADYNQVR